jgi:hypothetical protein
MNCQSIYAPPEDRKLKTSIATTVRGDRFCQTAVCIQTVNSRLAHNNGQSEDHTNLISKEPEG